MTKVIASVTNDLSTDQRVHKVCTTLTEAGYDVLLVGRAFKDSPAIDRSYSTKRIRLWFNKGVLFYATYNLRLFFVLLFSKSDLLVSNDLDTLLPNYLVSKIKGIPLIYDTHEYFCGMPELVDRPFVRSFWKGIESSIFPKLNNIMTVNKSVAELYASDYGKELSVIKNYPLARNIEETKSKKDLGLPDGPKIIIYQGAINIARGLEEAIESMEWVENAVLLIIGGGNALKKIQNMVGELSSDKIILKPSMPFDELRHYTANADLGLAIEKDESLNYKYSLSNKLFDYIHAKVPILSSRLIENERLLSEWEIGTYIDNHEPRHIAEQINYMLSDNAPQAQWKEQLVKAKAALTWESQNSKLLDVYIRACNC